MIELKAVSGDISRLHTAQIKTYLRGRPDVQHGVVINFTQPNSANATDEIQYSIVSVSPVSVPASVPGTEGTEGTGGTEGTEGTATAEGSVTFSDDVCH